MPDSTVDPVRLQIADTLDAIAREDGWSAGLWQRFNSLFGNVVEDGLIAHAHEELIHYSGEFSTRNLLLIRVKPDKDQVQQYKEEFRSIASALRSGMCWDEYKRQWGIVEGSRTLRALASWIKRKFSN